jgi:hypothetical protein
MTFDNEKFSKAIRKKRVEEMKIDLRTAGKSIGVNASTLSRLERGGLPDIITFGLVCDWLNKDLKMYLH